MAGSIKRVQLVQLICKQAHITRKESTRPDLTKNELLKLHSFLVLTNDVINTKPEAVAPLHGMKESTG